MASDIIKNGVLSWVKNLTGGGQQLGGRTGTSASAGQQLGGRTTSGYEAYQTPSSGGSPSGGYGYGYGYGGGGGGSTGPTDAQKKAGKALEAIAAYGADTLTGKAGQADRVYDINDQGSKNLMQFQSENAENKAGAEWFSNLLKEQSVYDSSRDKMGNARYGSGALDLNTDVQRVHDATASGVLETLEDNLNSIDTDYYQALQSSINGRNEMAMDTEAKLREGAADFASQLVNIHPDLATGEEGDNGQVIDTDGRKVNIPDWLPTEYFDGHVREAVDPERNGHIRPDAATQRASEAGLGQGAATTQSAANRRYWEALTQSYGQRKA